MWALNPENGAVLWKQDVAREIAGGRGETLFGGAVERPRDGMIRATSSKTGQLFWQFDAGREFQTVNGVQARGGSMASGGPTVANRMMFTGYPGFQGGDGGNVLLAFAPAVRLDIHADELKRRAGRGGAPR